MSKTVYYPGSAYGGWEYRVTSDGVKVRVQECAPGRSTFKTKRILTPLQWALFKDRHFNAYNNNPAWLSRLCNEEYFDPEVD